MLLSLGIRNAASYRFTISYALRYTITTCDIFTGNRLEEETRGSGFIIYAHGKNTGISDFTRKEIKWQNTLHTARPVRSTHTQATPGLCTTALHGSPAQPFNVVQTKVCMHGRTKGGCMRPQSGRRGATPPRVPPTSIRFLYRPCPEKERVLHV